MKKLLVVALVPLAVLAAVGAVAYVLLIGPIFALPVGVAVAESALATDDLILLAGLNVKQMTFLERWFLGRPAISVANGRPLPEAAVGGGSRRPFRPCGPHGLRGARAPRHPALSSWRSVLRGQRDRLGYLSARPGVDAYRGVELDPDRGSVIARHARASSHEPTARGAG